MAETIQFSIPLNKLSSVDDFISLTKEAMLKHNAGCEACCSGLDIFYRRDNAFRINNGKVAGAWSGDLKSLKPTVTVDFEAADAFKFAEVDKAIRKAFELSGCAACCSGMDLLFENMQDKFRISAFGVARI